jgi:hypothetical protein
VITGITILTKSQKGASFMPTKKPQARADEVTVTLDAFALKMVHEFRERYQQWQACDDMTESQSLGKQVDHLQMCLAFYLDSAVEKVEAAALRARG